MASHIKPFDDFRVNIIYLLIKDEHDRAGENIYKVGKTEQPNLNRFLNDPEYKKGVKLLHFDVCINCHTAEREILFLFNQKYVKLPGKTREYFRGNCIDMKNDITNITKAQTAGIKDGRVLHRKQLPLSTPKKTIIIISDYQTYIKYSNITELIITNSATFSGYMKINNESFYREIKCQGETAPPMAKFIHMLDSYKVGLSQKTILLTSSSSNDLSIDYEFDMHSIVSDIIETKTRPNVKAYELAYDEYIIQTINPSNNQQFNIYFVKLNQLIQVPVLCSASNRLLVHPSKIASIIYRPKSDLFDGLIDSYFTSLSDRNQFKRLCYYVLVNPAVCEPVTLNDRIYQNPPFIYEETYRDDIEFCLTDWLSILTKELRPDTTPPLVAYSRNYSEMLPPTRMIIVESVDVFINKSITLYRDQGTKHIVVRRRIAPEENSNCQFNSAGMPYNSPIRIPRSYNAESLSRYMINHRADIETYLYQINGYPTDLFSSGMLTKNLIGALFTDNKYFANEIALWAMNN